jgi:GNAT superfamily N-acetyltransferase
MRSSARRRTASVATWAISSRSRAGADGEIAMQVRPLDLEHTRELGLPLACSRTMPGMASRSIELRVARHTDRFREVVEFYRDGIGLREIGGFRDHDGYDGVFLEIPGTSAHLEISSGGAHRAPEPHPESLLVLYVGDVRALRTIAARLRASPIVPANPYWAKHGLTFADPDGFGVVLVPEHWSPADEQAAVRIVEHRGPRNGLRWLFDLAEDSEKELETYIDAGRVLVALDGEQIVAHLQITDTGNPSELEIKSVAVDPALRQRGVGRALIEAAVAIARTERRSSLLVATTSADAGNLRFYQRVGFRMRSVERDAFTEAKGYEPGLAIRGIPVRDRVWLDRSLEGRDDPRDDVHAPPETPQAATERAGTLGFELGIDAEPALDEIQYLEDRLYEYNAGTTGISDGAWLAIFARDEHARIVGGICGNTWGGCFEVRQLWVDEVRRKQGLGTSLLAAAEQEARRRGCRQILLMTFTFQAPAFYAKHGFEVVAAVDDHPRSHKNLLLRKRLVEPI